jgi:hypothetical protein
MEDPWLDNRKVLNKINDCFFLMQLTRYSSARGRFTVSANPNRFPDPVSENVKREQIRLNANLINSRRESRGLSYMLCPSSTEDGIFI